MLFGFFKRKRKSRPAEPVTGAPALPPEDEQAPDPSRVPTDWHSSSRDLKAGLDVSEAEADADETQPCPFHRS